MAEEESIMMTFYAAAGSYQIRNEDGLKEVDFTLLEQLCDIKQAPCTLNTPQRYDIGIIKHVVERIRTGVSNTFDDELSLYEHLECLLKSGGIQFHFLHLFKIFLAELVMRQDIPQQHTPDTELRNRNWLELP